MLHSHVHAHLKSQDAERLIMRSPHIHYRLSIPTPWAVLEELVFLSPTCSTLARIYPDRWHELNGQFSPHSCHLEIYLMLSQNKLTSNS